MEWLKLNHPESNLLVNFSIADFFGPNNRDELTDYSASLQTESDVSGNYTDT